MTHPRPPRLRRRDRGFSLLVVFMLMIVMVGAAATVMLSTQEDLSVAGQDREQLQAFYAAEYGVAAAKDYIASLTSTFYSSTSNGWTPLLTSGSIYLCAPSGVSPPVKPGTQPGANNPWGSAFKLNSNAAFTVGGNTVQYHWCIHNDAEDLSYTDRQNDVSGNGDTSDLRDSFNQIVIESYGQLINTAATTPIALASSHLTVYVGAPTGQPTATANCYGQAEGCSGHTASTTGDTATVISSGTTYQRTL